MKKILALIALGIVFVSTFYLMVNQKPFDNRNVITVGILSGYAPYAMINESGAYEGFDIDIAQEIGKRLSKKIVFQDMSLAALFIALNQSKIDLILSGLSITPERQQAVAMIYYQGQPTTSYPLVFWQEIPSDVKGIEDFKGKSTTICVEPGSTQEKFLMSFDFLSLKQLSNNADIILDLKYKKSAAALMDPDVIDFLVQQNPELKILSTPLPKEFQSSGCGIAIKKENNQLASAIRETIANMLNDGTITRLEQKWFSKSTNAQDN